MGKYIRKCTGVGEIAVMEVAQVGVKTRARTLAMAAASASATKRRKIGSGELQFSSPYLQLGSHLRHVNSPEKPNSPATSENSGGVIRGDRCSSSSSDYVPMSRCSSNGSSELVKDTLRSVDLEGESLEIENSTYFNCSRERRETTPSSEIVAESDDLDSMAKPSEANSCHMSMSEKMPSEAEIEEFFCAAEKVQQKRFAEKYNYDIVKDVPLEGGHYEWLQLKP